VQKALEYEIQRQAQVLDSGERVVQETRLWDVVQGKTRAMRSKEEAHDYRYFPDPDLVPVVVERKWIEEIKATLPELPQARKARFVEQYGLPEYDAGVLTADKAFAHYFENCVKEYPKAKTVSNWIMGELLGRINETNSTIESCKITPNHLAAMLKLIDEGTISGKIAKDLFGQMYQTGQAPAEIVKAKGWVQIVDVNHLEEVVAQVLNQNAKSVEDLWVGIDQIRHDNKNE